MRHDEQPRAGRLRWRRASVLALLICCTVVLWAACTHEDSGRKKGGTAADFRLSLSKREVPPPDE